MYFAYVLKSDKDNSFYYGSSGNIHRRLKDHNEGKNRYTKGHRPWVIHYFEEFTSRSDAMKRELFFKCIDGYIWLKNNNIIWSTEGSPEGTPLEESLSLLEKNFRLKDLSLFNFKENT